MSDLRSFLRGHARIAIDSCIFIYALEPYPRYSKAAIEILDWVARPGGGAVASTIAMTEILVKPFGSLDQKEVSRIFALVSTHPNLEWLSPDLEIASTAAKLRALHRLKTPDALLAATALKSGATGLITNDPAFRRVTEFETLLLDSVTVSP